MSHALVLDKVSFSYEDSQILDRLTLNVPEGQFVTLLGASGSGKSTLLRLIAGLSQPQSGEIRWHGAPILEPGIERGLVFQDYALFPWYSMAENVAIAVARANPALSKAARRAEAIRHLRTVGLGEAADKHPYELSGGMQQRGAIARALALGSPLLLMDEPFGALDPVTRAHLQDLLLQTWEESSPRKTIVFVTHDVDEALYLGDRVVILGSNPGRILADLRIDFPRPRSRGTLISSQQFNDLRKDIAEILGADTLRKLVRS